MIEGGIAPKREVVGLHSVLTRKLVCEPLSCRDAVESHSVRVLCKYAVGSHRLEIGLKILHEIEAFSLATCIADRIRGRPTRSNYRVRVRHTVRNVAYWTLEAV